MRVNIFQATGDEQISKLETEINDWIERTEKLGFAVEIKHSSTAMCQISYGPDEGRLPQLVVTVWFDILKDLTLSRFRMIRRTNQGMQNGIAGIPI